MREGNHVVGFAFDGDGDRVLAVDRNGAVVDGDELIALAALHLRANDRLPGNGVAVTVMTNFGFHTAMRAAGIDVATTPVGDRYVLEALRERGWALGGEQSGHIIDMGFVSSGDGIAAALLTLEALGDGDLSERHAMEKLPQRLVNVRMADRAALAAATSATREAIEREMKALEGRGRVLVRPSGTEPLVRVMVEAPTEDEADAACARLVEAVETLDQRWGRSPDPPLESGLHVRNRWLCGTARGPGSPLRGAEKLEYRGYDSAGISVLCDGDFDSVRAVGNLSALRDRHRRGDRRRRGRRRGRRGAARDDRHRPHPLGHPRPRHRGERAPALRHRRPRPHRGQRDRRELHGAQGAADAGGALHLRDRRRGHRPPDLPAPRRGHSSSTPSARLRRLRGHYAFVAVAADEPELLVAARKECPLIVGRGEGEQFLASAIPAFLPRRATCSSSRTTRSCRAPRRRRVHRPRRRPIEREIEEVDWDTETAEKGGYETFMLKEIHEQPDAVAETVADRTALGTASTSATLARSTMNYYAASAHLIVACGTSYHAGLIGRYAIEEWARLPVEVEIASEYRYRNPVVGPGDLVIGITQSGETADTLAAMRLAE